MLKYLEYYSLKITYCSSLNITLTKTDVNKLQKLILILITFIFSIRS